MNKSLEQSGAFAIGKYFPPLRNLLTLAFAIAFATYISINIVTPVTNIAVLWLANGITLGLLMISPRRYWTAYLATSLIAMLAVTIAHGQAPLLTGCLCFANIVEIMLSASIMYWPDQPAHHFTDRKSAINMGAACILGPALSMFIACSAQYATNGTPPVATLQVWYLAHSLGLAIMTPLTLTILFRDFAPLIESKMMSRSVAVLTIMFIAILAVFGQTQLAIPFLVLPFLALAIFQLGFPGMTLCMFMLGIGVSFFTLAGLGPFTLIANASPGQQILMAQFFLGICAAMAYPIAVALMDRKRFERSLLTAQEQLRQLAATDQLTSIANRRMFDEFLDREWKRALRDKTSMCAIMIDVDCFKLYNDRYGHQAGDDCLRAVAESLMEVVRRPSDLVARYGGEEFVALLPATNLEGARFVAEQIRRRVEALQIVHSATSDGRVTVSLGVDVALPSAGGNPEDLIAAADALLYTAKERGRNCVCDGGNAPLKKHARS